MTRSLLILVTSMWMASCAVGAPIGSDAGGLGILPVPIAGAAGASGVGGMGGAGGQLPDGGMPVFMGDACQQGQTEACACDGGAMGERVCIANAASPTGGALSECRNCPAGPGDAGAGMTGGASGASGMTGGASGMTGGMGAGTGGMTGGASGASGMTGGMGAGAGGAGGTGSCMCMDPLACCRDDGSCGVGVPGFCF